MMTVEQNKDQIEAGNYSAESYLNKENKRTIRKMFRYIRTFPLSEYEIEQIRKDIIGMANEADQRGESLASSLGKAPREFCDDLIYAIGGIQAPGGRKLLRLVGGYYQIIGFFLLVNAAVSAIGNLMDVFLSADRLYTLNDPLFLFCCGISAFYFIAGSHAAHASADVSRAPSALKWGIAALLLEIVNQVWNMVQMFDTSDISSPYTIPLALISVIWLIPPIFYIIGARRNMPHAEEP